MEILLPCPYCGNTEINHPPRDACVCLSCGAKGPEPGKRKGFDWNNRVASIEVAFNGCKDKPDFSMDKIIHEVEARIAKGKAQKADATNPSHYSRWKIEPLDFISANNLDFLRGNIIKYIMRFDAKGGLEDLKKARVYLEKLIEKVERNNGMENN